MIDLPKYDNEYDLDHNYTNVSFTFPLELTQRIIMDLFYTALFNFHYNEACKIAVTSRSVLNCVYMFMYGYERYTTNITEKILRVSRTLKLLEVLHDDYLSVSNESEVTPSIMLCVEPSLRYNPVYYPWDCRTDFLLMTQTALPASTAVPGMMFGDTVFITGKEDYGVFDVDVMYHPVFLFGITDHSGTLLTSAKHFQRTDKFKYFSKLLAFIYGSRTGVFYMVKPEDQVRNPFITSSDEYIIY